MTTNRPESTGPRPVGVVHLVFGLIFCGIAALWLIGNANDADFPNLARGIPVVLIGAGLVGLGASTVNHRRAKARLLQRDTDPIDEAPVDTDPIDTDPIDTDDADPFTTTTPIDTTKDES